MLSVLDGRDVLHNVADDGGRQVAGARLVRWLAANAAGTNLLPRSVFESLQKYTRAKYGYTSIRYLDEQRPFRHDDMPRCVPSLTARMVTDRSHAQLVHG
jgi:hypothetical protein